MAIQESEKAIAIQELENESAIQEIKESEKVMPVSTGLIERDIHDHILNLAVITGEHVLFVGPPGTAKSLQASVFFKNFDAKTFSVQLSKFSTEEILFGPLNIEKLRKGKIEYLYENSILTADFAYIDEIFDASDVLLRTLLGVLNERKFSKGSFSVDAPLITAVATANYSRVNKITEAVIDRFLFQFRVNLVKDKRALLNYRDRKVTSKIPLGEIKKLRKNISKVSISKEFLETYIEIGKHFEFSDRRLIKGLNVLKANAVLQGRKKISEEDFFVISYLVGIEEQTIMEALKYLAKKIPDSKTRNKQLLDLKQIEKDWKAIKEPNENRIHLLKELEIIKKLKKFDPIDEIAGTARDKLLSKLKRHFKKYRDKYVLSKQIKEIFYDE
ncbi:MAG: AAA family ATPase [Promethearchaeota archaeon]